MLQAPLEAQVPDASTGTPAFFQVKQDTEVPEHPESLDATILAVGGTPVMAIDVPQGFLSVRRSFLVKDEGCHANTRDCAGMDSSPSQPIIFTGVEWGIGERRIHTAASALKLLKVLNKDLLLCSSSAGLAEAVDLAVSFEASSNKTGRRALLQGVRRSASPGYSDLECGRLASDEMCLLGSKPPNWSAGDRAVFLAGRLTPKFAYGGIMLVCAPIGPILSRVMQSASPAVTNSTQTTINALAALVGCLAGNLALFVTAVIVVHMRNQRSSKGTAAP